MRNNEWEESGAPIAISRMDYHIKLDYYSMEASSKYHTVEFEFNTLHNHLFLVCKLNIMSQNRTKHNLTIVIYNLARGNRNMDVQII